ncbi:MAG: ABC transporter permease [Pseudomonadota bacterium]
MDAFLFLLAPALAATINAGTPLMLAAFGLLLNEKSGVLNLGAEGMMLLAAIAGFAVTVGSGSATAGFAAGALAGMAAAAFFGWMVLWLGTNQYATGLALSIFGGGLSAFAGIPYTGISLPALKMPIPYLSDIPFAGDVLFRHHPMVYLALLLCAGLAWFLTRSRAGLVLRAVGESPESAHALGYNVRLIRLGAVVFGGACCGLAGAYLAIVYTPMWQEGMTAGKGWIALALTTFACWKPWRVVAGAWLFGGVTILQLNLQGLGVDVAPQIMAMLPYVATIVVLALISRNPHWIRLNIPASLGKNFNPDSG